MKTKHFLLCCLAVLCSISSFAHDFEVNGIYYNKLGGDSVAVTWEGKYYFSGTPNYWYSSLEIIPSTVIYNNFTYRVVAIGDYAFYNCVNLTAVEIPNSVTSIGKEAFYSCDGLTSLNYVGDIASWCAINFGEKCITTYHDLYINYARLTAANIPDSVTSIGNYAFAYCKDVTSVTIGNSVTHIGDYAFFNCGIASITLPNSVTHIGKWAFARSNGDKGFSNLSSVIMGNSLTSIGDYAFFSCFRLSSIKIPNSVTYIGDYAFDCCANLTGSIVIPDGVTSIGICTFSSCDITSIVLGNGITSIGRQAFYGCDKLTSIDIPNSVKSIGRLAFQECYGLTSVNFGNSVTSIGSEAFYRCRQLTSIDIPNSVTSIGSEAFAGCTNLVSADIGDNVKSIGYEAFRDCGLTSITIPNSVTLIGDEVFSGCTSLFSANIGNNVTSIEESTFSGCTKLTEVTIGNSVTSIGYAAFYNCTSLQRINALRFTPPQVATTAFDNCPSQCVVSIPCNATFAYKAVFTYFQNFIESRYLFKAVSEDITKGTVQIQQAPSCTQGDAIILAIPEDGYQFVTWSDGEIINPRTITLTSDTTITALFTTIPVIGIILNESKLTLSKDETAQLTATITPEDAANKNVVWSTSDSTIVTVEDGLITAIEAGKATITATTEEGGYTASCKVTVILPNALDDVEIDTSTQVRKVFENGTIYILRNGDKYTIDGRKAE